jgi:hypothetical protein
MSQAADELEEQMLRELDVRVQRSPLFVMG